VPYRSGWDCLRRILAEEGVRGLFAGLSVNLVRGVTGAILLVAYDDFKKLM
jgi:solute carrier family 25 (adenine nucleotide translocator) protein 4/5/6/31